MDAAPPTLSPPDAGPRARLVAGMAAAIRERGSFQETTVADVVRHARTSRRTFYEHFKDRDACFLALHEELSEDHLAQIAAAAGAGGAWTERVDRALGAWLAALSEDPVLARACIIEIWGVGPAGVARGRRTDERWARQILALAEQARADDPSLRPMSLQVAAIITGGLRDVVLMTLDEGGDVTELHAVGADLIRRLVTP